MNPFKIAVNADNVFDTQYGVGGFDDLHAYPGAPLCVLTTVRYTF